MNPVPDHGEDSYRGSGRLTGRKALITALKALIAPFPKDNVIDLVQAEARHSDRRVEDSKLAKLDFEFVEVPVSTAAAPRP